MILAEPRGARAEFLRGGLRAARARRTSRSTPTRSARIIPERVAGVITRAVGVDPRDARPGGVVPGTRRPDDLHERAGLRRRDRRGRRRSHAGLFRLAADHAYEIPGTPHRPPAGRLRAAGRARARRQDIGVSDDRRPAVSFGGEIREIASASNPTFKLLPRPPGRPGHPQARRGDPGRAAHPRRGPGAVPRARRSAG